MIRLLLGYLLARLFARIIRAAYGTPTDPTSGTIITVAFAIANFLNPIRALRAFTGGADPPGSGYVVESSSTTATSWVLVNAAKIASWLGYTPLNKAGDTVTGGLVVTTTFQVGGTSTLGAVNSGGIAAASLSSSGTLVVGGTSTMGAVNAGAISGSSGTFSAALSALSGAFTNAVTAASATLTGALNAASAAITNGITAATVTASGVIQGLRFTSTQTTGTAPFTVASTTEVANLNAAALSGEDWHAGLTAENSAGATPTTSYVDISGCSVTLDRAGSWLILGVMVVSGSAGYMEMQIVANGVAKTPVAGGAGVGGSFPVTASTFVIVAASNGHIAKLQFRESSGGVSNQLQRARIAAIWLAP